MNGDGDPDPLDRAEALETARTKLVADLARMPEGTLIELLLNGGARQVGAKRDFGSQGIWLEDGEEVRYADIASFRDISTQEAT